MGYALAKQKHSIQSYTSKQDVSLHVSLVERKKNDSDKLKEERKKSQTDQPKEIKPVAKPSEEEKKASSAKEAPKSVSLQGLFNKIDTSKLPQDVKEQKKDQTQKTRLKPNQETPTQKVQDAGSKIANSLNFSEQKHLIDTKRDGVYDPFIGKIQEILEENWQKTVDTESGNVAKVIVKVNDKGNFSYKIVSLSYNNDFNNKLKEFLKEMERTNFPPFEKGPLFEMQVEFKDILE